MTTEECTAYLADARSALHQLRLGQTIVSVSYGDRRIQYSQANMNDLIAYVQQLEAQCGTCAGAGGRRPFGVIW